MAEVVRILLGAGASPNTNDGGRPHYRSALTGAVEVNNPDITEVLLGAGASPDPGQPIGAAAGHRDHRCLRLLLSHGARVAGTWAVGAAAHAGDPVAVSLLLGALQARGDGAAATATEALPDAAAEAPLPVVTALVEAGADPRAADSDGVSALRRAVRAGKDDTAAWLKALGATDDSTDADRFIGACLNGDRLAADRLLADHPGLQDRLSSQHQAIIVEAAASKSAQVLALLLDLGFSPDARNGLGEQPLHTAAYHGNAAVIRLMLGAGADVDARDTRFDATPLAFATVGSGEQADKPGNWIETVAVLIDAGAGRQDVWLPEKPPSEEVADLLRRYGITPAGPARQQPGGQPETPGPIATGAMADIARHLQAAYRDLDLDLLGSLLHPRVRWTGACSNSGQVLDWYRRVIADGTMPTLHGVEVDRDAVVLGLTLARQAEGARPAPPQQLYQAFTIDDAQIIDINGYPDRHSAFTRTQTGSVST